MLDKSIIRSGEAPLSPTIPEKYKVRILRILKALDMKLAVHVPETECFGHRWIEDNLECEYAGRCDLAPICKSVYQEVEAVELTENLPTPAADHAFHENADNYFSVFLETLGNPAIMHKRYKFVYYPSLVKALGRMFINKSKTYYNVFIDNVMVAKYWIDVKNRGILDLNSELGLTMAKTGVKVVSIPDSMARKLYPCSLRIHVISQDLAKQAANTIKQVYNV